MDGGSSGEDGGVPTRSLFYGLLPQLDRPPPEPRREPLGLGAGPQAEPERKLRV